MPPRLVDSVDREVRPRILLEHLYQLPIREFVLDKEAREIGKAEPVEGELLEREDVVAADSAAG
jgi:hypothetical protein